MFSGLSLYAVNIPQTSCVEEHLFTAVQSFPEVQMAKSKIVAYNQLTL